MGFPGGTSGKQPTCQRRRHKRDGFDPWVRKILWRRVWQPIPVFLSGESRGHRSLVGNSSQGHKESDTTEASSTAYTFFHTHATLYFGVLLLEILC